jgi:hypothetical protein
MMAERKGGGRRTGKWGFGSKARQMVERVRQCVSVLGWLAGNDGGKTVFRNYFLIYLRSYGIHEKLWAHYLGLTSYELVQLQ